ncbi:MAG: sporulation integral membrane protein YtvI [Caldicoprobacter oshimai]|uniref:Sporulation integral membrane protein YtvI n=1 Tax=Caldicoprobacter faecalis TaxID=937334 RepID=A0A1I5VXE8_9FIRM|nr:sporulation integral membrane protein YtvI [Caldicoprobacter faecalis]PZN11971.1 MAG: sporulation integral membrane protein YtvI [Caldicoprobacter oshimai]SFQ12204.1 sporulation integral membrane protein YtvI [Caldicoprobacter faecalis]
MVSISPRYKRYLKSIAWIVLVLLLVLLLLIKVIPYVAPFVVALFITFIIERPVSFLTTKLKLPRGTAVGIVLLFFTLITGGIVILIFSELVNEIWRLTREIPSAQVVREYVDTLLGRVQNLYLSLPAELERTIRDSLGSVVGSISVFLQSLLNYLLDMVKFLPQLFLFIVISLVSSFFMSRDREKISRFVYKQIPEGWRNKVRTVKEDLFAALMGFIKAQSILISVTFIELLIGYSLIGVKYVFSLALITAVVDALPVLGTGTILIPAAAINLIMGNVPKALAFIALYIVILIVRQFLEPKVVGQSLGLHPLVTLISIYVGLQLFGIIGLFLGPIIVAIIKALQKARILPQWKA